MITSVFDSYIILRSKAKCNRFNVFFDCSNTKNRGKFNEFDVPNAVDQIKSVSPLTTMNSFLILCKKSKKSAVFKITVAVLSQG